MKPRYNLRIQSTMKPLLSTTKKKKAASSRVANKYKPHRTSRELTSQNRRHSLRLTPQTKETKFGTSIHQTMPKWRRVENETLDDSTAVNNDHDDDYEDLLARHHQHMLEEQKDRKLYERYIRDQRTLRRLQCRRTHSAHLNQTTRNRLLRELERERRYTIQDKICAYLANRTFCFRHGCNIQSKRAMNWSTLEEEVPQNRNIGTIHDLDVMISNLKKANKMSISKPRLSVRERQSQRSKTIGSLPAIKSDYSQAMKTESFTSATLAMLSNPSMFTPSELSIISHSPRVPIVRFIDDSNNRIRTSSSQHLTSIQNVLSHHQNPHSRIAMNEMSTPTASRKAFLRPKSSHVSSSDSPPTKKRAVEKENCSIPTASTNTILRATSPMVSIKHTSSSSRVYPNTRKHPISNHPFTKRRHTRFSTNA